MRQAFRYEPPELRPVNVIRPTVQKALANRFSRRLTTLLAGPGFGKTTALARAISENRLSPLGIDVWLACEPDDDASTFTEVLSTAIGRQTGATARPTIESVTEAIAWLAPTEVCLMLDDAHRLDESARRVSIQLIESLPANGHVVWSGRSVSGANVHDETVLRETDLLFTADQTREAIEKLADNPATIPADDTANAGWPALVEVTARRGTALSYIDNEVLRDLGDDAGLLLDALVAAGRADRALLAEVCPPESLDTIGLLPLVDRIDDDIVAHDIWHELRAGTSRVAHLRRKIADGLARRDDVSRALDVLLGAPEPERFIEPDELRQRDDLLRTALHPRRAVTPERMRRWDRAARAATPATPASLLLRGLVARLDDPASDVCLDLLDRATRGFVALDDARGESIALSSLTYPLHVRGDTVGLQTTLGRLGELAHAGIDEAEQQSELATAIIATSTGDLKRVEQVARRLVGSAPTGPTRTAALWMLCNARNGMGESSLELADELMEQPGRLPGMCAADFTARWQLGMVHDLLHRAPVELGGDRDRYVMAVWNTFLAATTGDLKLADEQLSIVRELANAEATGDGSDTFAESVVALERGHAAEAARRLRLLLDSLPFDGRAQGSLAMGAGLIHLLLPECRAMIRALRIGPLVREEIEIADALVTLLDGDPTKLQHGALPREVGKLLSSVGLRHTAMYLAAARELEVERAPELINRLVEMTGQAGRNGFARAAEHHNKTVAAGARAVLSEVPVQPDGKVAIKLLGRTELELDGAPDPGADWRRERVRALLVFILLHPTPTRELVMAELWPDADAESARRSLRSTLNRLHHVLEPERGAGHAPFHVTSSGQQLAFRPGTRVHVDVHEFSNELALAGELEAAGTPSLAIDHYRRALDLYRGDLLPANYSAWVLLQRDVLRSRFVAAGVRCTELLSAAGRPVEAIEIAERVLPIEPYSEPAHRALVSAQLSLGDVASARRSMATCEALLGDVGGVAEPATAMVKRRLRHSAAG